MWIVIKYVLIKNLSVMKIEDNRRNIDLCIYKLKDDLTKVSYIRWRYCKDSEVKLMVNNNSSKIELILFDGYRIT